MRLAAIGVAQQTKLDLLPFLEKYGQVTEGVDAPDGYNMDDMTETYVSRKILDYTNPLDVELGKDVYLTGIGWIDDQLHVQIGDRQQHTIRIGETYPHPISLYVWTWLSERTEDKAGGLDEMLWHGEDNTEYSEYISNARPDETENMELYAVMTEITDVLRDEWEVRIPLEDVLAEGEETTSQGTAAPAE